MVVTVAGLSCLGMVPLYAEQASAPDREAQALHVVPNASGPPVHVRRVEGVTTTDSDDGQGDAPSYAQAADAPLHAGAVDELRPMCDVPAVALEVTEGCLEGEAYPDCKYRLGDPREANHLYTIWRNTVPEHRWGRRGLVHLLLATAGDFRRAYPGEPLAIGDLDAPGPRHTYHRSGVDVDLYLPGFMAAENDGSGRFPSNYPGRASLEVRMLRARVLTLAKILATCTQGQLRILYNDPVVETRFNRWFKAQGLESPYGKAMQAHNELHRFHFHVTVAEELDLSSASVQRHGQAVTE